MLLVSHARWPATTRVIPNTATFIARRASRLALCLGSTLTLAGFEIAEFNFITWSAVSHRITRLECRSGWSHRHIQRADVNSRSSIEHQENIHLLVYLS